MSDIQKLAILIVDDRYENLCSMKQLLARPDLEILTAASGNEALGLMLENELALVLLDVQMPGMDGFEVAELMRRNDRTRRIPIIFVTAINKERRHIFTGFEAGAVDYMFKPVDPFIIRSKVKVFLDIKRNELAREKLVVELDEANRRLQGISSRKSDFLSAASHELRTPLTIIKEYCGLVHDEVVGPVSPDQKKCMEAALRNCNRLADLVNDLLDLDSIESGHQVIRRTAVDLSGLLTDAFADFEPRCRAAGLTLAVDLEPHLPPALGDGPMLTQVVVNLLGNALKFTPAGGRITIRGRVHGGRPRVEIADTGPGIAPADQARVFEKFTQLSRKDGPGAKGTGLGLAISHKIMELMNGELGLESQAGQGAVFHFALPAFTAGGQLRALVTDGIYRGLAPRQVWSLVLLRPAPAGGDLPPDLDEILAAVSRRTEDLAVDTVLDDRPAKAVLLQGDREGALAFLARLESAVQGQGEDLARMQFALKEISPEFRQSFTWEPETRAFRDLALVQENKGMSHV